MCEVDYLQIILDAYLYSSPCSRKDFLKEIEGLNGGEVSRKDWKNYVPITILKNWNNFGWDAKCMFFCIAIKERFSWHKEQDTVAKRRMIWATWRKQLLSALGLDAHGGKNE